MELAIINGTYRDNSNGKPQNGLSPNQRIAVPANITTLTSPGINRFAMPAMSTMPTLMAPNVLRPVSFDLSPGYLTFRGTNRH